jgi:hypothetical protein
VEQADDRVQWPLESRRGKFVRKGRRVVFEVCEVNTPRDLCFGIPCQQCAERLQIFIRTGARYVPEPAATLAFRRHVSLKHTIGPVKVTTYERASEFGINLASA